jgi:hypothetical protein
MDWQGNSSAEYHILESIKREIADAQQKKTL